MGVADELIALATLAGFFAVGQVYADFFQTSEAEAVACPERPRAIPGGRRTGSPAMSAPRPLR